jgi:hypothetical protein
MSKDTRISNSMKIRSLRAEELNQAVLQMNGCVLRWLSKLITLFMYKSDQGFI